MSELSTGKRERLEGWGRYPRLFARSYELKSTEEASPLIQHLRASSDPALAYGLGRSYGDAALTEGGGSS